MIKIEHTEVFGWEAAIRGMYNGKGVRWVYPGSYEAYISAHGKFLSCGTYPTEDQAREAVAITKIKLFEASVIAHGDDPRSIVESVVAGYFAAPSGNIYNRHGDLMEGAIDRNGYRHTIIGRKNRAFHRVIAETFVPNPDNLPCVNHKDGNKLNNSAENLEWCTHSENVEHSYRTGLQEKATNPHGTYRVLSQIDLDNIRTLHESGLTDKDIACSLGCSRGLVSRKIREMGIR